MNCGLRRVFANAKLSFEQLFTLVEGSLNS